MTFNILITVDNSEFLNVNLSTRSRYRHSYHAFKSLKIENRALKLFLLKGSSLFWTYMHQNLWL